MKHAVDDSLIYLTDDIIIQNYPNTVNAGDTKSEMLM